MKNMIIAHNGSIQNIPNIPDDVKAVYKTVWEISQKKVLDLAADRGAFICQSQSLNVHLSAPTSGQLTSMHFYGWKKGLKTGMYYLRTRPAAQAVQFTVDQSTLKEAKTQQLKGKVAAASRPQIVASAASIGGLATPPLSSPSISSSSTRSDALAAPSESDAIVAAFMKDQQKDQQRAAPSESDSIVNDFMTEQQKKAAEADPEFAAALQRKKDREYEEAKLLCSLENKESCVMCSG